MNAAVGETAAVEMVYIKSRGLPGNAFRAPVARLLSSPAERQISHRAHPSQIIAAFVSAAGVPFETKTKIGARAREKDRIVEVGVVRRYGVTALSRFDTICV